MDETGFCGANPLKHARGRRSQQQIAAAHGVARITMMAHAKAVAPCKRVGRPQVLCEEDELALALVLVSC